MIVRLRLPSAKALLTLFWLFLLVFPKGGIKLMDIPITWGYLLLCIATLGTLYRGIFVCYRPRLQTLLCTLPFQTIIFTTLFVFGAESNGLAISLVLGFILFPWMFLFLFSHFLETIDLPFLFNLLKQGILLIAIYGIFLFFFKLCTGTFLQIPLLTINLHDMGSLETKHIDRGAFFKLISTYNNGNIYGICLLMLIPLYLLLESRIWKKSVVLLSLFLTFSRTVWIGLLFSFCITTLFASPRRSFIKWVKITLVSLSLIFAMTYLAGFDLTFLFDAALGGRLQQLEILHECSLLPHAPFYEILEIVYLSILSSFGILGLLTYLLSMIAPIFIAWTTLPLCQVRRRLLTGLINFLLVSLSDGALLLIPILAFYWILSSLALRSNIPLMTQELAFRPRQSDSEQLSRCPNANS